MLEALHLSKNYNIKEKSSFLKKKKIITKKAVIDVSLKLESGQIIGLLGINGAGKTTTIKMLSAILSPTSGSLMIDSIDAIKKPISVKKIINVVTGGERNLYWRLTAKENLQYFGSLYGIDSKTLSPRIDEILNLVQLYKEKDIPVEKYSKGMKQRLQIARGLINDPKYIFLDEPTLGLDILIARELRSYIKNLAKVQNKGILLTTHYMEEAESLCDYIYIIHAGSIIFEGTPDYIKTQYKLKNHYKFEIHNITKQLEMKIESLKIDTDESVELLVTDTTIDVASTKDLSGKILSLIEETGCDLQKMTKLEPTLEDSLISMITGK